MPILHVCAYYQCANVMWSNLVCALGHQSLMAVLTRCGLPLPLYVLVDEKHSRCLTDKVYLPTIVRGRVLWHLGYTEDASAAALTQPYQEFQRAAVQQEPAYRVRGILTDGFDSTVKSLRTLFPGARLGNYLRHAINKLPKKGHFSGFSGCANYPQDQGTRPSAVTRAHTVYDPVCSPTTFAPPGVAATHWQRLPQPRHVGA